MEILVAILPAFVSGLFGVIIGGIIAQHKMDKNLALLEQHITGRAGVLDRLANLESAVNARRIPDLHHTIPHQ